ncbi:PE-PGRS family protein [Kitasatospora sp. NPDC004615]|uniref:PE-PGRS family protein n=1 Tax=Kitasatospora sp. NPDC004615 TaxID=3364017 RepID=UPI00367756B7
MKAGRVVRAGRAAVFAAGCVLLAAVAHVLMSGRPVAVWVLAAAFGGVAGLGWLTARRERGPLLVTALTVGVQAALHTAFSFGQATAAPAAAPAATDGLAARWAHLLLCNAGPLTDEQAARLIEAAGLDPGTVAALTDPPGMAGVPGMSDMPGMAHHAMAMAGPHGGGGGGMLAAHLLAALLLGLWLAAGERAVHGLARTVAARLFAPVLLLLGAVRPAWVPLRSRRSRASGWRPRSRLLVHSLATRGPPVVTAVA